MRELILAAALLSSAPALADYTCVISHKAGETSLYKFHILPSSGNHAGTAEVTNGGGRETWGWGSGIGSDHISFSPNAHPEIEVSIRSDLSATVLVSGRAVALGLCARD